jgi:preprotein translocase subunit SecE
MTQQNIQTVGGVGEQIKMVLAIGFALSGGAAFQVLSSQPIALRIIAVLVGVMAALVLMWFTHAGQQFLGFSKESVAEAKRVVWPTRKESLQMTGIVFVFVLVMAIYLLVVDKTIEWVLYDFILSWKR